MYTNLYLVEQFARQRHQEFIDQAARDRLGVELRQARGSLAEHILRGIRRRLSTPKRWLANRRQHEQLAPEA